MTDWTDGYVADIDYTFGYYSELNPQRLRLAFLNTGLQFPEIGTACELGFGQGMSANLHATASVARWFGTDFNPTHTQFAQTLADISGTNAQFFDQAFAEFCSRTDLPDFDYIALHGVWSWISDENRAIIVDFLQRKLKVGGVVYINYNTPAGWAAMMPMRDLLLNHMELMGSRWQGSIARFDSALHFADKLLATNPLYINNNPLIPACLEKLKTQHRDDLIRDYFNRDWQPLSFSETASLLSKAKLTFACSAQYLDHVDPLNLTDEQQDLLAEIPDVLFRETVRDFCVNQHVRYDYWIKGAARLNALEQIEALRAKRVVLVQFRANVPFKVTGNLGESALHKPIYSPILDVLSNYQPKTLAEIEHAVAVLGISLNQVIQAVMVLIGAGVLCPAHSEAVIEKVKLHTDKLNDYLCHKARGSSELAYLVSPVTGGGIAVPRFFQLFLLAKMQGYTQVEQWAQFAWSLESESENIAELIALAHDFEQKQLPVLMALGICA